jgi:methylated-DNA-[protein]-cysteine S-methyltransferase
MSEAITYMDSPLGLIKLWATAGMLSKLHFVDVRDDDESNPGILSPAITQLKEFFDGKRTTFDTPLHPEGTHFQLNVWDELKKIPYGRTCSYEDLARRLGDIKVIRAAATANGRNPLPIIIPCHRVIGKNGSLTGYSGGLWRKQFLLELEQRDIQPKLL